MSAVGETLRKNREARGLTVEQVSEVTKMRTDHVRALEDGNYDVFPAKVYVRGFVRSYANFLGIEFEEISPALEEELGAIKRFREPPSLSRHEKNWIDTLMLGLSRVNWRILLPVFGVLLAGVLAVSIYQAWRRHKNQDPLSTLGPGYYTPPADASAVYLPIPTNPPARSNR